MEKLKEMNNNIIKIGKLLMILILIGSIVGSTTLISSANVSTVTFQKTYNKNGKFYMPIVYTG